MGIDWPEVQRQVRLAPQLGRRSHHMRRPAGNHQHIAGIDVERRSDAFSSEAQQEPDKMA